eukprot:447591-Lingulodinium_polyedra.AAC.1
MQAHRYDRAKMKEEEAVKNFQEDLEGLLLESGVRFAEQRERLLAHVMEAVVKHFPMGPRK